MMNIEKEVIDIKKRGLGFINKIEKLLNTPIERDETVAILLTTHPTPIMFEEGMDVYFDDESLEIDNKYNIEYINVHEIRVCKIEDCMTFQEFRNI